ncbi:hypothetical protein [Hyphobacterium sp.]|uniref:hypothetical protein n=1 Tax=Hyphobacterium sp. TaxID=2004662 RepID=UPI00374868F7
MPSFPATAIDGLRKMRPRYTSASVHEQAESKLEAQNSLEAASKKLIANEIGELVNLSSQELECHVADILEIRQRHRRNVISMDMVASYASARHIIKSIVSASQNLVETFSGLEPETIANLSRHLAADWTNDGTISSVEDGVEVLSFAAENLARSQPCTAESRSEQLLAIASEAMNFVGATNALDQLQSDRIFRSWLKTRPSTGCRENGLASLIIFIERYHDAAASALVCISSSGPHPPLAREETASYLIAAYEVITGLPATHTPRSGTKYDGGPHSAAAVFVAGLMMDFEIGLDVSTRKLTPQKAAGLVRKRLEIRRDCRKRGQII